MNVLNLKNYFFNFSSEINLKFSRVVAEQKSESIASKTCRKHHKYQKASGANRKNSSEKPPIFDDKNYWL